MQDGRFSRTAAFVAALRALGHRGLTSASGFHDPTADSLLPGAWARGAAVAETILRRAPEEARRRAVARTDMLVIRTLAIDSEIRRALERGCTQIVLVGAGFDGRAHRLPLEACSVFEVDHPATQHIKRGLAIELPKSCAALTYVPCDFERNRVDHALESASHRIDTPTVWILEGVTLYLTDEAIRKTLHTIASRSAPGSTVIVEYHDADEPRDAGPWYSGLRRVLLSRWAEPQIGGRSRAKMRAEIECAGLSLAKDFSVSEWGVAFAGAKSRARRARLAVAHPS